jgi:hypothetical protein
LPAPQLTVATVTVIAVPAVGLLDVGPPDPLVRVGAVLVVTVMTPAVPWPPGETFRLPVPALGALVVVAPLRQVAVNGPTVVPPTRTEATRASANPAPAWRLMPLATTAPLGLETEPPADLIAPLLDTLGRAERCSPPATEIPVAVEVAVAAARAGGAAVAGVQLEARVVRAPMRSAPAPAAVSVVRVVFMTKPPKIVGVLG